MRDTERLLFSEGPLGFLLFQSSVRFLRFIHVGISSSLRIFHSSLLIFLLGSIPLYKQIYQYLIHSVARYSEDLPFAFQIYTLPSPPKSERLTSMGFIHGLLALGPSVGLSEWGIPFGDQRDGKAKVFIPLTFMLWSCLWLALQFSHSVLSDSLQPHGLSTPGFPVRHQLPDLAQTHVRQVSDAIQPSHPLSSPSPPAFNLSHHQGVFQ